MTKILVTGASGLLGSTLVPALLSQGHDVIAASHRRVIAASHSRVAGGGAEARQADLRDLDAALGLLDGVRPDTIVNLVAATSVDQCEKDPQHAFLMNVNVVANLVAANARLMRPAHLIHLSTDHVYDGEGRQQEPHVTIRNQYAMSKLAGEFAALAANVPATILRVNFFGPSHCAGRASFSDWIAGALKARTPIQIFSDVWFSPLRMATLASVIGSVAAQGQSPGRSGVFNVGANSAMSKAGFALALADALGLDPACMKVAAMEQAPHLAQRPRGMVMDSSRFEKAFGIPLPRLEDELGDLAREYQQ